MAELSARGIKWFMIAFNLLLFIFGIVLIALGAAAKTQYYDLSNYFDHNAPLGGTVSPASLLIAVGVFIAALSFLGCFTAVRETYALLVTFAVILGILFIIQFAGAIAMYVQRDKIMTQVHPGLTAMFSHYNQTVNPNVTDPNNYNSTATVDRLQKDWNCCGVSSYNDWFDTKIIPQTNSVVAESCCRVILCGGRNQSELTNLGCGTGQSTCPINTSGCKAPVENAVNKGLKGVAGAAIAFAIIELIGLGFTAYLAKRIRSGYTYA